MSTPNKHIPYVPEGTLDPAAGLNLALNFIDALLQTAVVSMDLTAPPGSPIEDGALYIVAGEGGVATGDWAGHELELARYYEEGDFWQFFAAGSEATLVLNLADGGLYKFVPGSPDSWTLAAGLSDAPEDGQPYGRRDGVWEVIPDAGSMAAATVLTEADETAVFVNSRMLTFSDEFEVDDSVSGVRTISLAEADVYEHFSDMDFADPTASGIFYDEVTSTATVADIPGEAGHPGIVRVTKSAGSGQGNFFWASTPIVLADGTTVFEALVRMSALQAANTGETGVSMRVGLMDSTTGDPVDGVYFWSHPANVAGRWRASTIAASTGTFTDTGFSHAASAWVKFRIEVNADGTSVEFFINGSSVATHTTNIPTVALRWRWQVWQAASYATGAFSMDVDYCRITKTLTTPR